MSATLAVVDTSVVIYLYKIGRLALLCDIYRFVLIPRVVFGELKRDSAEAKALRGLFCVEEVADRDDDFLAEYDIDPGESQVIAVALASASEATVALIDDGAARKVARALDLSLGGTLGILALAKKRKLIGSVRSLSDAVIEAGYRIRPSLYETFLQSIGE